MSENHASANSQSNAAERQFNALFERALEAIFIADDQRRYVNVNPAACRLLGLPRERIIGRTIGDFADSESRARIEDAWRTFIERGESYGEWRLIAADGSAKDVETAAVANISPGLHLATVRDVTDRKRAEEELRRAHAELEARVRERTAELARTNDILHQQVLQRMRSEGAMRESEERYRTLVETSPDAITLTDIDSRIVMCNRQALSLHGYHSQDEVVGRSVFDYVAPDDRGRAMETAINTLRTGEIQNLECMLLRNGGNEFPAEVRTSLIVDPAGKPRAFIALVRDITERKQLEHLKVVQYEELERSRRQLRDLAKHLQAAREAERARIAREVHDELGQTLTALDLNLSWLEGKLPAHEMELRKKIGSMFDLIDTMMNIVHRISAALRPGILDELGLAAAIEWEAREFEERTLIPCEMRIDPPDLPVDGERATTTFRIFQEALTNVARHSSASSVQIVAKLEGGALHLQVTDNGCGIDRSLIWSPQSLGLLGMRERVAEWGGSIRIDGTKGKGTSVTVEIPLEMDLVRPETASGGFP